MYKALNIIVIIWFLVIDWLTFHDIFKAGETYTVVEYLTGTLSILVIYMCVIALIKRRPPVESQTK